MAETTGTKLAQARLAKGLTVDEVAYATKLRPDKILALEHDDYSRFPNNAYVKGFLQIYGRYLEVDVVGAVRQLESRSPVNVADYQYLNRRPDPAPERLSYRRQSNKPSLAPLIVFLVLSAILIVGGYVYLNAQRLGNLDSLSSGDGTVEANQEPAAPAKAAEVPPATPAPAPRQPDALQPTTPQGPANSAVAATSSILINTAELDPPAPEVSAAPSVHEVVLQPLKKTWVRVRRDRPDSEPIFEGELYTSAPPLKLRGARFFIEVREEGAIAIRKNGAPIAYQSPGVTIQ